MIRVAIDATPLLDHLTGIGIFTDELLRRLPSDPRLHPVAYATSWKGRDDLATVVPAGVRIQRRPMAARPLRRAWRRFDAPPIEWWTGPVDVVHGTNFVVPPTRRGAAVVSIHDLTPVHFPELCTADTLDYPDLIRRALNRGAHVHTDSAFVANEVQQVFGVAPDRVTTIHLGVNPVPDTTEGEGRALAGAERYVLALGTVEPRKGLPSLVRAFDHIASEDPDLSLVIAGPDGWGVAELQGAIEAARERRRIVRVARYVSEHERAALMRDAEVFAFPSLYEGFGLPPLEAMQAGTPVVATRVGSLPEVLGNAALLVAPGDPDELASALARALADGDLRSRLAHAGRERAALYTWDRTASEICDLYISLAGGTR